MTRTMDSTINKATTISNWVEEFANECPEWKTKLIGMRLDEILHIIDTKDRRALTNPNR